MIIVGLMSGTSLDGFHAPLIATDLRDQVRPPAFHAVGYSDEERSMLRPAVDAALAIAAPGPAPALRRQLWRELATAAVLGVGMMFRKLKEGEEYAND